eukprot:gene7710-7770_t
MAIFYGRGLQHAAARSIGRASERLSVLGRRQAYRKSPLIGREGDKSAVEAILGGVSPPAVTLRAAMERYFVITRAENMGKRPDQLRRWENSRKLSIENFVRVLGEDKPVGQFSN